MVALEALKSSGDDTGELGNNHEMDPQNSLRCTARLYVIDMNININIVSLEPVANLLHQTPTSIFHLRRL